MLRKRKKKRKRQTIAISIVFDKRSSSAEGPAQIYYGFHFPLQNTFRERENIHKAHDKCLGCKHNRLTDRLDRNRISAPPNLYVSSFFQ